MIVWLTQIAAYLAGLIGLAASEEGRRWVARGIALGIMLTALVLAFGVLKDQIQALGDAAFQAAAGELTGDALTTLGWVRCVTPSSMPAAIASAVSALVLAGAIRLAKWVVELKMG